MHQLPWAVFSTSFLESMGTLLECKECYSGSNSSHINFDCGVADPVGKYSRHSLCLTQISLGGLDGFGYIFGFNRISKTRLAEYFGGGYSKIGNPCEFL